MKTFAYVRVSSKDQNETRQIETMKKEGIADRDIFVDKASGKDFERPKYQALKAVLREGDVVIFDSITRMGRNMDDTVKEYNWLVHNGIQLRFVKEPMLNTSNEYDDVMKKAIQQIVLTLLSAFAQKEREEIRSRQAEGIATAKKKGVKFGRPSIEFPKDWDINYKRWKAGEITAVKCMNMLGLTKATFYRKVKEFEATHKE
ncbi:recombinase family protein [Shimazuella kribbensis]|uniref:recombinase family protein n=1 Tax=Shimazuella kribbensis TaxID=139808 RepID=UPI00041CD258|nr:recombinase family protein [Shimazuella kribbensis]